MRGKRKRQWCSNKRIISNSGIDKITQIDYFRFMEEISSNRYNFVLYVSLVLEPMKRFEYRSDVLVLTYTVTKGAIEFRICCNRLSWVMGSECWNYL